MDNRKGSIVSKSDFLKGGLYSKEQYEGVLASADPRTGDYNIGVQLSENEVLIVDHADSSQVRDRLQIWHAQAADIQRQHGVKHDSGNYSRS